jgi:hypothetical protein
MKKMERSPERAEYKEDFKQEASSNVQKADG